MQGDPPQQRHFQDTTIPSHITYAFKKDVKIAKNDDFYQLPNGKTKSLDVLFLIANAPVSTAALPEGGSESYVGLSIGMQLAMQDLSESYPLFFGQSDKAPNQRET